MGNSRENIQRICKHYIGGATVDKKDRNCKLTKFSYKYFLIDFKLYFVLNKIIVVFNETSKISQFGGYFLIK